MTKFKLEWSGRFKLTQVDERKALRARFAMDCPKCAARNSKLWPSKLIPQQKCARDGYRDKRPAITLEQWIETCGDYLKEKLTHSDEWP